jgi:hypothetical protein
VTFCQRCCDIDTRNELVWSCGARGVDAHYCQTVVLREALSEAERKRWTDRKCACGLMPCPQCATISAQCAKCRVIGCIRCLNTCQICQIGRCSACAEGDPAFNISTDFELMNCDHCNKSMHRLCGKVSECADCDMVQCGSCAGARFIAACESCRVGLCERCAPSCRCAAGCGLHRCTRCATLALLWLGCDRCADLCCPACLPASAQGREAVPRGRPCRFPGCDRMLCRKCEWIAGGRFTGKYHASPE